MKKLAFFSLVLIIILSLCACRMGKTEETTPDTQPPATTAPQPTETEPAPTEPTIIDPTIAPNVPDPSVDDDHLIDPTEDGGDLIDDLEKRFTSHN